MSAQFNNVSTDTNWNSFLWELLCTGFRHSAGLHARVILDGATCRLSDLGDVRYVLSVLVVW